MERGNIQEGAGGAGMMEIHSLGNQSDEQDPLGGSLVKTGSWDSLGFILNPNLWSQVKE